MAFLQPWLLWALPAVLLPLLIHLLNRLRYRTVHWGAMLFLRKADRSATRRAKIRQYLLLACRMLVILFLIWAMARPLIGGWLGAAAGGAPEVVLILLDRSASMEAAGPESGKSKRAHALELLAQAASQSPGSQFVFLENVLLQPLELADASRLATLQLSEASDTAADLPAMLRAALEYLATNKPGSAELWLASDLQASNWRPDSGEWQDVAARFSSFSPEVSLRILDLSAPVGRNLSVAVKRAELRLRNAAGSSAQLALGLEIKADAPRKEAVPVRITREGTTSQTDVALPSPVLRQTLKFDLPKADAGWGKIELPADDLLTDNAAYFAYAPPVPLRAVIVGEGLSAQRVQFALAPDPTRGDRTAEIVPVSRAEAIRWKDTALIVWLGPKSTPAVEKTLSDWVQSGGVLLTFPPSDVLGGSWSAEESAPKTEPFPLGAWDELDGPLAKTDNGTSLPLPRLEILRRQPPTVDDTAHVYASFADGRAFLVGRSLGAGQRFACATLPEPAWSSLGDGFVLVPMMQRLLALGGQRLAPPVMGIAGVWQPADPQEMWTALEVDQRRDWRWHAGIYQSGAQRVALNRPPAEDLPDLVDSAQLPELLRGVRLTVMRNALELKADRLQSEIWPAMIIAVMLFMCLEMALATSRSMVPQKPAARPSVAKPEMASA